MARFKSEPRDLNSSARAKERERERREAGWGRGMRGRERGGDAVEKERGGKERKGPGDRQERIERSQVG